MAVGLDLTGKTALITGGARGIGAEMVRLFTQAGARVAFNYRQARERADALVSESGGTEAERAVAIEQELSSPAEGRELVQKAAAALGRLDILVVNHGIWPPDDAPIAQMDEAQWRRTMAVNLDSVFGLVQAAVAQMERQGRTAPDGLAGHIVLISSTAGQRGEAYHADYAVTKGALISLTKSLSSELAPKGIQVNCVAPGWVETEMSAGTLNDPIRGPKAKALIPVGRAATPREIAGPVLFLCTPLAGFISGEVVNVNGGAVLVG
ncbi:SDR family NAD(P)-dependent oxidoreductase [Terracidiphilus gabretensis]|jgi:3-oxoacyl-[acyl-carrier protein] reductase|uniref:SDR family NAD(P)-dependent oxidoreductase n=1 Tax=Terracidiphilus gabretensis TaxID=1577687 RepID=UPI00071B15C6|nr:SDR family NAD(P)-dependent oxidoreductase [Terracidiphilus gabretensis]